MIQAARRAFAFPCICCITCTPADITYPTDLKLLSEAREKTEEIIDRMHEPLVGLKKKSRTYRQKARKDYLAVAKQKRPSFENIRKAIRKQLGYLKRNLHNIDIMASEGLLKRLSKRLYRLVLVIKELYQQQLSALVELLLTYFTIESSFPPMI